MNEWIGGMELTNKPEMVHPQWPTTGPGFEDDREDGGQDGYKYFKTVLPQICNQG